MRAPRRALLGALLATVAATWALDATAVASSAAEVLVAPRRRGPRRGGARCLRARRARWRPDRAHAAVRPFEALVTPHAIDAFALSSPEVGLLFGGAAALARLHHRRARARPPRVGAAAPPRRPRRRVRGVPLHGRRRRRPLRGVPRDLLRRVRALADRALLHSQREVPKDHALRRAPRLGASRRRPAAQPPPPPPPPPRQPPPPPPPRYYHHQHIHLHLHHLHLLQVSAATNGALCVAPPAAVAMYNAGAAAAESAADAVAPIWVLPVVAPPARSSSRSAGGVGRLRRGGGRALRQVACGRARRERASAPSSCSRASRRRTLGTRLGRMPTHSAIAHPLLHPSTTGTCSRPPTSRRRSRRRIERPSRLRSRRPTAAATATCSTRRTATRTTAGSSRRGGTIRRRWSARRRPRGSSSRSMGRSSSRLRRPWRRRRRPRPLAPSPDTRSGCAARCTRAWRRSPPSAAASRCSGGGSPSRWRRHGAGRPVGCDDPGKARLGGRPHAQFAAWPRDAPRGQADVRRRRLWPLLGSRVGMASVGRRRRVRGDRVPRRPGDGRVGRQGGALPPPHPPPPATHTRACEAARA